MDKPVNFHRGTTMAGIITDESLMILEEAL